MKVEEYLTTQIYNLCNESIGSISDDEWIGLNNDINQYLSENALEETIECKEIFQIKANEYQVLSDTIHEMFIQYPLIADFFDNNRDLNFPPLDMIRIIRLWCQDFVQCQEDDTESHSETSETSTFDQELENLDQEEYITIRYFQGLFGAIYELFMERQL